MLREDKNVVVQALEVVTDPHGELETPSQIEEHIRAYRGLVEQWNESIRKGGRWNNERRNWEAQRDGCLKAIADFEASLAQPRQTVYQLQSKRHVVQFAEEDYTVHLMTQTTSPVWVSTWEGKLWWWYLDRFWWDSEGLESDDVQVLVLQRDRQKQATLERARAEVLGQVQDVADERPSVRRLPIAESVRHEVWRRDQGRCVDCGSRENLEFDHIIPFSKGGSNTARNLELRCESCNRRKGATI